MITETETAFFAVIRVFLTEEKHRRRKFRG